MQSPSTMAPLFGCITADRPAVGSAASASSRTFYEGPSDVQGDVHLRIRYFTYQTAEGLVAGRNTNEMFTIDRPAKSVWPYLKDFNLWQNAYGFYYSGVVGDLEGRSFQISSRLKRSESSDEDRFESLVSAKIDPNEPLQQSPFKYDVLRVVPEHLIVISQPVPEDGSTGGVSPGFHVLMLNEHSGKTVVTFFTEHAARTQDKTEEEALAPYREGSQETLRKFRDCFIPALKKLVYEGDREDASHGT